MANIIRGIIIGITDLIPGISGGTIAMVLGIYHELISAINGIFTKNWRLHILFLAPLVLGIGISIITFSRLIEWLIQSYSEPLFFFFNGLILGIIPFLLRTADYKQTFKPRHYIVLVIATIFVASTSFIREDVMQTVWTNITLKEYIFLFLSGWIASSAMILPGISGSLIFLLLGVYPTVINAISNFNVSIIFVLGIGVLFGLIFTSKLIEYLFRAWSTVTYASMIGLVLGSLVVTFPGFPTNLLYATVCIAMFFSGSLLAISLGRFEHKNHVNKLEKRGIME